MSLFGAQLLKTYNNSMLKPIYGKKKRKKRKKDE